MDEFVSLAGSQQSGDCHTPVTSVRDDETMSDSLTISLSKKVLAYYNEGNAEAVMSLIASIADVNTINENDSRVLWDPLLLWVRPGPCCLSFLADQVREAGIISVASVGCGTGLLEWLINATTGLFVTGYEINGEWWSSKYAPPTFIQMTYVDPDNEPPVVPNTHALMCCYFNNAQVFRKYINKYDGPLLIIIGSTHKAQCTEPRPYDYKDVHPWTLKAIHNISESDVIAVYERDPWKVEVANKLRIFGTICK